MAHVLAKPLSHTRRPVLIGMGLLMLVACGKSLSVKNDVVRGHGAVGKVSINGGQVTTIASGLNKPYGIYVDGTDVYFSEAGAGAIRKVPTQGGTVTTLADGLLGPRALAVEDGWVYFAERGRGTIKKVPTHGGTVTTLASGLVNPTRIAIDSEYVYFCENAIQGAMKKVSKYSTNGRVTTLADGLTYPNGHVVSQDLFFLEVTIPGTLSKISNKDGARTVLANDLMHPAQLAADQTHLYVAEGVGGTIKKVSMTGGVASVLASGLRSPLVTAVDEDYVYFTERERGTVGKVSKSGGPVITLAEGLHNPWMLTVDHDNIYFTEGFDPIEAGDSPLDNIRKADARPVTASNSAQIDVPYSLRVVKTQRLTSTPDISEYPIAWSPDGKYLAATVFAGNWGSDIHMEIIPVKDGQRRRLLPPSSFYDFHPVWSPDGTRIAFFSNRSGNLDVWTVNSDGTNLTQLTTSPADDLYSVWSPDGEKIAFLSTRSKEAAIWIMNGDGTDQRQITAGGNGDWGMAWNPHNGLIAFGSTRLSARNTPKDGVEDKLPPSFADMMVMGEPSRAIWTVDLQTFILKKLTQEKENGVNWHPVWSPDGKKIAYISNKAGTEDVWVMDYDGGHPAQLTSSELYEVFPVWSPDGAQLAYASSKHYKDYSDIKILTLEKEKLE